MIRVEPDGRGRAREVPLRPDPLAPAPTPAEDTAIAELRALRHAGRSTRL